jgi:hypothetical protein
MAWAAPATFTVSQVVTAAQINVLSDDLKYLKGQAGAVTIEDELILLTATFPALLLQSSGGDSAIQLKNTGTGGRTYRLDSTSNASGYGGGLLAIVDDSSGAGLMVFDGNAGNFGIGLGVGGVPQGRLHAKGVGGGFMFLSANAVTSLQTLAQPGTVSSGAVFYIIDRNNTGGANVLATTGTLLALGATITYVNNDTIVVTLTAGGGIQVTRTVGTNGTHDINMLVLYR